MKNWFVALEGLSSIEQGILLDLASFLLKSDIVTWWSPKQTELQYRKPPRIRQAQLEHCCCDFSVTF